jgi:O-antigen ligase
MNGMLYVYKSMLNKLQNEWRNQLIFVLLILMMIALFTSRAFLSLTMTAFVIVSFIHHDIPGQFRKFFSSPLLWGISLLFFIPLISGLWSADKSQWLDIMRIKLPLLFIPLAFAAPFGFHHKHWEWLATIFLILVFTSVTWSAIQYFQNYDAINESYLRAKTLGTALENDHVRYSWLVTVAVLLAAYRGWQLRHEKNFYFWLHCFFLLAFIFFIHLLAARTGLLSFYIMLAALVIRLAMSRENRKYTIPLLLIFLLTPVMAYLILPSFRNRMSYIRYDYSFLKESKYVPGANDVVRTISLKAGCKLMKQEPVRGVGFGDIPYEMRSIYRDQYPQMEEQDKILPSSEWLMYGTGAGWVGFILFTIIMIIPFFVWVRDKSWWILLNLTAALSFLFDIGLEVQFGVFIYVFVVCWWYKWMVTEKI